MITFPACTKGFGAFVHAESDVIPAGHTVNGQFHDKIAAFASLDHMLEYKCYYNGRDQTKNIHAG